VTSQGSCTCSSQQASPASPQAWKAGCGSAFPSVSLGAKELGERLRLMLHMMPESGASIYPSKSKSVMRYSRKRKDAQLNKFLLAESLAAITASPSPPLESVAIREHPVNFCQRVFLFFRAIILPHRLRWVNLRGKVFPKRL